MTGVYLTLLLSAIIALALVAKAVRVPYPVVFVIGGLALALVPHMPPVRLQPDLVFLLFLPALIFGDGWSTDARSFFRYLQPILLLAIGLVAATSVAVAFAARAIMGIPLALGFLLGAILSPTDAVATEEIAEEAGLPKRLAAIAGGESLVNDATGLVLYRFALVAVAGGAFSVPMAALQFVYVSAGGIVIGLAFAWVIAQATIWLRTRGLTDPVTAVAISLVAPYAVYVPADALGASGVLAALSGGIYLSSRSTEIFDPPSRIAAGSIWNFLFFAFNGAAFVLIGLQLPTIVQALREEHYSTLTVTVWAIAIAVVVMAARFAWVFPISRLRRAIDPRVRRREGPDPPWTWTFALSLAGMRGIVSLAAALSIPDRLAGGAPFPGRALILFVTFVVILVTLVGEGLTMPWFIRRFGVRETEDRSRGDALARVRMAEAARARMRALEPSFASTADWEVAGRITAAYEERVVHFSAHLDGSVSLPEDGAHHEIERRLRREAQQAERRELDALRTGGEITDEHYRTLQHELDLAESRVD